MAALKGVFEGGGIKGIGLVGAFTRVEEKGIRFNGVAGTSAGSIVAALYAAGYTAQELKRILTEMDFSQLLDPSWPKFYDLWNHYGIYKGKKLHGWIYEFSRNKGVVKFRDFPHNMHLQIVASNLAKKKRPWFSINLPTQRWTSLKLFVCLSGSRCFLKDAIGGNTVVVDGGIVSNYPLWLFRDSRVPIIGFKLVSAEESRMPHPPTSLVGYLSVLLGTMMEAHDKEDEKNEWWANTIHVNPGHIPAPQFSLTPGEKAFLFNSGYFAATQFLDDRGKHLSE